MNYYQVADPAAEKIYVAEFGGHLFYDLFLQVRGEAGMAT